MSAHYGAGAKCRQRVIRSGRMVKDATTRSPSYFFLRGPSESGRSRLAFRCWFVRSPLTSMLRKWGFGTGPQGGAVWGPIHGSGMSKAIMVMRPIRIGSMSLNQARRIPRTQAPETGEYSETGSADSGHPRQVTGRYRPLMCSRRRRVAICLDSRPACENQQ